MDPSHPDGFETRLTELLGIRVPVILAGMAGVSGPELVAAVSNAGGMGTLGCVGLSPAGLRSTIRKTRTLLNQGAKIGVDLLLPKVGGGARATNKDYTSGQLGALVEVMIDEKIDLFVSAVGVPPKEVVEMLHAHGIIVMNMVGSPRHVAKALAAGVDGIIAQGTEGGAHTGQISTLVLLPQVVDLCRRAGVPVIGAGGVYDGRGIAACLALGADGVWVGSRFIVTPEANVPRQYIEAILRSSSDDTIVSEVYTGRPLRHIKNTYSVAWETERAEEKRKLLANGTIPLLKDLQDGAFGDRGGGLNPIPPAEHSDVRGAASERWDERAAVGVGQCCGALTKVQPAAEVVAELMDGLGQAIRDMKTRSQGFALSRL